MGGSGIPGPAMVATPSAKLKAGGTNTDMPQDARPSDAGSEKKRELAEVDREPASKAGTADVGSEKKPRLAEVDREPNSKAGPADKLKGETDPESDGELASSSDVDYECCCELRFAGDNEVAKKFERPPIWVLPEGAQFPADACKAYCDNVTYHEDEDKRGCGGPLHDPCESRGVSFGCDRCC